MVHRIQLACLGAVVLVCMSLACGCGTDRTSASSGIHRVDAAAFETLMKRGKPVILDVRTPQEFAAGHIPGAVNLNVNSPSFTEDIRKLDSSQVHLVYCRSGRRSQRACSLLNEAGFEKLNELTSGIQAWQAAGKPVER